MARVTLTVNGQRQTVDVAPDTPLLWVLRENLGLTGTKFGCGIGRCSACMVHVDGNAQRSCRTSISSIGTKEVVTIEAMSSDQRAAIVQRAWIEEDVPQCGYCQSGQIMAAVALLKGTPNPTDAQIDAQMTNVCRCGTYNRIRRAIHRAAQEMKP